MRVSDAITHLSELNPDEQIIIQWVTREHVENTRPDSYPVHTWNDAVAVIEDESAVFNEFAETVTAEANQALEDSF